jgi:hypothetical protein
MFSITPSDYTDIYRNLDYMDNMYDTQHREHLEAEEREEREDEETRTMSLLIFRG